MYKVLHFKYFAVVIMANILNCCHKVHVYSAAGTLMEGLHSYCVCAYYVNTRTCRNRNGHFAVNAKLDSTPPVLQTT